MAEEKITKKKTREDYTVQVDGQDVAQVQTNPDTGTARINANMYDGKLVVQDMDASQCEQAATLLAKVAKKAQQKENVA